MTNYLDLLEETLPPKDHPRRLIWRNYALEGEKRAKEPLDEINLFKTLNQSFFLDIGCGDGGFSVAAKNRGCNVIALEVSERAIERAQARFLWKGVDINLIGGTGTQLPFKNEFCDVIVLNDVIEHVPSPTALLRESYRILKPGGVLYISAVNAMYLPHILADPHWGVFGCSLLPHFIGQIYVTKFLKTSPIYDVWELPTHNKMKSWLSSAGFSVLHFLQHKSFLSDLFDNALISVIVIK